MDPAARLGVPPDADAATVRAAFARCMRAVHPDVAGPGRDDSAREVADLLAARDHLIAARDPLIAPTPAPSLVVFYQRLNLIAALRARLRHNGRIRRHLS